MADKITTDSIEWILSIGQEGGRRVLNFFFSNEEAARAVFDDIEEQLGESTRARFTHLFGAAILDLENFSDILIMPTDAVWLQQMFAMENTYKAQSACQVKYSTSIATPQQAGKFVLQS